jgi:hypothetical protein
MSGNEDYSNFAFHPFSPRVKTRGEKGWKVPITGGAFAAFTS